MAWALDIWMRGFGCIEDRFDSLRHFVCATFFYSFFRFRFALFTTTFAHAKTRRQTDRSIAARVSAELGPLCSVGGVMTSAL